MILNAVLKQIIVHTSDATGSDDSGGECSALSQDIYGGDISPTTTNNMIHRLITNKIHIGLFIFHWLVLGNILIPMGLSSISALQQKDSNITHRLFVLREMIATLMWMGYVFAISGMEAWLKFKAPFCPRAYKLDIGRTIFPALNAVELASCLTCWQQHITSRSRLLMGTASSTIPQSIPQSLILVTSILALDMVWLTPKLVHRGKQVVYQYIKHQKGNDAAAKEVLSSKEFIMLKEEMGTQDIILKKDNTHVLYVLLEVVKLFGLGQLVISLASSLLS